MKVILARYCVGFFFVLLTACGGGGGGGDAGSSGAGAGTGSGGGGGNPPTSIIISATSINTHVAAHQGKLIWDNRVNPLSYSAVDATFQGAGVAVAYAPGAATLAFIDPKITASTGTARIEFGVANEGLTPGTYSTVYRIGTADSTGANIVFKDLTFTITIDDVPNLQPKFNHDDLNQTILAAFPGIAATSGMSTTLTTRENTATTFKVVGTDPENDPISISVAGLPSWASFSAQHKLEGTPSHENIGSYQLVFTISDGISRPAYLKPDTLTITISVAGEPWNKRSTVPEGHISGSFIAVGEQIYAIGGKYNDGTVSTKVSVFHTDTNTWTATTDLPVANKEGQLHRINDMLYLLGGRANNGTSLQRYVYRYSLSNHTWTASATPVSFTDPDWDLGWTRSTVINDKIYLLAESPFAFRDPKVAQYDPQSHVVESQNVGTLTRCGGEFFSISDELISVCHNELIEFFKLNRQSGVKTEEIYYQTQNRYVLEFPVLMGHIGSTYYFASGSEALPEHWHSQHILGFNADDKKWTWHGSSFNQKMSSYTLHQGIAQVGNKFYFMAGHANDFGTIGSEALSVFEYDPAADDVSEPFN